MMKKGFTLIEVMIFIAIMVIIIVTGSNIHNCYRWLAKENNYSSAIRQLKRQEKIISNFSFDKVPPEILSVQEGGKIQLSNNNVISDSVIVMSQEKDTGPYKNILKARVEDTKSGLLSLEDKNYTGKKILVKYSFLLSDSGEGATVPKEEPFEIKVFNGPVNILTKMELVEGDKFTDLPSEAYKVKKDLKKISIDKKYAGKVIRITYTGDMIRNICTGEYMDDNMNTVAIPTDMKLIKIQEAYGGRENIESGFLKVR
jgi:prepilin-type N-terminal cleavage/methylation domain-containing protein